MFKISNFKKIVQIQPLIAFRIFCHFFKRHVIENDGIKWAEIDAQKENFKNSKQNAKLRKGVHWQIIHIVFSTYPSSLITFDKSLMKLQEGLAYFIMFLIQRKFPIPIEQFASAMKFLLLNMNMVNREWVEEVNVDRLIFKDGKG